MSVKKLRIKLCNYDNTEKEQTAFDLGFTKSKVKEHHGKNLFSVCIDDDFLCFTLLPSFYLLLDIVGHYFGRKLGLFFKGCKDTLVFFIC